MIHNFAVLKKYCYGYIQPPNKEALPLIFFIVFCLCSSTSLASVEKNWVELMQIHSASKSSIKKSIAIFIYSHMRPCRWHIQPADTTSTQLEEHSCLLCHLQLTHSGKQRYPQAAQAGLRCLPPHHLAPTRTPSTLLAIKEVISPLTYHAIFVLHSFLRSLHPLPLPLLHPTFYPIQLLLKLLSILPTEPENC